MELSPAAPAPRVVVIGGGLAGMAAAVALESAGAVVTLLEARKSLGGRAGSFEDARTGEILDNCQHVLLGCCTNLLDFYRRLGVKRLIRWEKAILFLGPTGRRYALGGVQSLPAPLNLAPAMARFGLLTLAERVAVSRAMLAMMRLGRDGRATLADVPFGDWLDEHRQPAGAIKKLYDPVLVSGLNEETRAASAEYAIKVFQDSLLAHRRGSVMGVPSCPLAELYAKLPARDVRLGVRVAGLVFENGPAGAEAPPRVRGVRLADESTIDADAVVLATNHHSLSKWVPSEIAARDSRFGRLDEIQSVPILGVHLWFDRPVMTDPHAALVDGPLQWLFRKDDRGAALHGVISAARQWPDVPREAAVEQFVRQIRDVLPAAREARLERSVVVIEKRATFSPLPGIDRLRPPQAPPPGGIANLYLAGDYTRTGWPATMEGAVRAGYLAAEAVHYSRGGRHQRFLVDDLTPEWPARWLARR